MRRIVNVRVEHPILVVDDSDDVRSALADLLRYEGFTVVEACNGKEALTYLLAATMLPSLMLLDLNMPVMTGWEVIRALRAHLRFASLPIVLVTAERMTTDPAHHETVGRLSKPFLAEDVLSVVRQHVSQPPTANRRLPA